MANAIQQTFYTENALRKVDGKMKSFMTKIATEYANEVKERMRNSPATGRTYTRGKITHRASAPGEPPAPDTGNLLRHVTWRVRNEGLHWFAEVGNTLPYALYLEYGAAKGIKNRKGKLVQVQWILFPRPVWGPALYAVRRRIPQLAGSE